MSFLSFLCLLPSLLSIVLFLWSDAIEAEGADFTFRQANSSDEVFYLSILE